MTRQLIVVDVETTGLFPGAAVLEVAAINVDTGESLEFAPYVHSSALGAGDRMALSINRYYERRVWETALLDDEANNAAFGKLADMLHGNTFAGSNPTFDSLMLRRHTGEVWHHRLADLAAYAAGVLGIPLSELPGLSTVCDLLGVTNEAEHSAGGDARATAECFRKLAAVRATVSAVRT